jgi:hypothetical protein
MPDPRPYYFILFWHKSDKVRLQEKSKIQPATNYGSQTRQTARTQRLPNPISKLSIQVPVDLRPHSIAQGVMLAPIGVKQLQRFSVTSLIVGPLTANFPPSYLPILDDAIPNGRFNPRTIPQFLVKNQIITGDPNRRECHPSQ